MQNQLSALSELPVNVLSPLDALAAELGTEAARVERELRRELALGLAEFRQERAEIREEREAMRRQFAELELRVTTAERERDEAIRARLATLRDGEDGEPGTSVTIEAIRPVVIEEIARQYETQPKVPEAPFLPDIGAMVDQRVAGAFATVRVPQDGKSADPEKTAALVRDEVANATARIAEAFATPGNVHEIAQSLIDKALAALPASPTASDIETTIEKAGAEYTKAILQPHVAAAEARIVSELDRREAGFAERIDALPKPLEAEAIGELAEAAAEMVIDRCMPDIAQRAAGLVPAPDIAAAVAGELERGEGGIVDRAVAVAREEIQRSADDLRGELAPHSDAEIQSIARDAAKAELVILPPSLTVEQVWQLIERAVSPLREAIDALPEPLDTEQLSQSAAEKAAAAVRTELTAEIPTDADIRSAARAELDDAVPPLIDRVVTEKVAALPKPEPGHTPTGAELAPLVDAAVEKRWATLPPPEKGDPGPPGKLPIARSWRDEVHYESTVVTHKGGTYQAVRDTGREPPHEDWICLAKPGEDGADGRSFIVRGTYADTSDYRALDVVVIDGSAFVARRDDPGPCPGDGWQLLSPRGKPGKPGDRGIGLKGDPGPPGPGLRALEIDNDAVLTAINEDGTTVSCDLYPLLSKLG